MDEGVYFRLLSCFEPFSDAEWFALTRATWMAQERSRRFDQMMRQVPRNPLAYTSQGGVA